MFVKLGPNAVQSDEGYRLRVTGRNELEYAESERILILQSEPLKRPDGEFALAVYLTRVKSWASPRDDNAIDAAKLDQIRSRIEDALKFLGTPAEFD